MQVVESLQDLILSNGLIGVMSSGQGSVANNVNGMRELYCGSKAALNQFMRSYAARHKGTPRAMVLMAPGWVRTDLGGPDAHLSIDESVPNLVNILIEKQSRPGLEPHCALVVELGHGVKPSQVAGLLSEITL